MTSENDSFNLSNNVALKIMQKMGYKVGSGLGKNEGGPLNPIEASNQLHRKYGLGYNAQSPINLNLNWDFDEEDVQISETLEWFSKDSLSLNIDNDLSEEWIRIGPKIITIENETNFCSENVLHDLIEAKEIFNICDANELYKARARANPFESIKSSFFMNRAALKMANIDKATDFMFTNIDENDHHKKSNEGPFYFADVCAGPGGFTEYILWRKKWLFKGFGFTLKSENDFELEKSVCISPLTFNSFYGSRGDGNIYFHENIFDFKNNVLHETKEGVHFMMADGGFSVEGCENLQEILSKQLYVCQCLTALEIVRSRGHFVTKLFDTFTLFSVGLIYLISKCFEKISIFKPNSSRPGNSERYLICQNLIANSETNQIRNYLRHVVKKLEYMRNNNSEEDINEIVPLSIIKWEKKFCKYIYHTNNRLGERQLLALKKMTTFCYNPTLRELRQNKFRNKCLKHWKIPHFSKVQLVTYDLGQLIAKAISEPKLLNLQPQQLTHFDQLNKIINDPKQWHYVFLNSCKKCNFYAAVEDSKVFRLVQNKWEMVQNVYLIKGTLLYGEMLYENNLSLDLKKQTLKQSLHVIDAVKLGDTKIEEKNFNERSRLIKIYCESINHSSREEYVKIRAKESYPLVKLMNFPKTNYNFICNLPSLEINISKEYFNAHSLLLLKTETSLSFIATCIFRIQVYLEENRELKNLHVTLEDLNSILTSYCEDKT